MATAFYPLEASSEISSATRLIRDWANYGATVTPTLRKIIPIANTLELRRSSEANSCSDTQDISGIYGFEGLFGVFTVLATGSCSELD
jgi:hypothetical protein